jgi:hypothetical protein
MVKMWQMSMHDVAYKMGNPQPRVLETGSRFNDYSKYPNVYTMEKGARMGSIERNVL